MDSWCDWALAFLGNLLETSHDIAVAYQYPLISYLESPYFSVFLKIL